MLKVHSPNVTADENTREVMLDVDDAEPMLEYLELYEYASIQHVTLSILWKTMMRVSAARALDVEDGETKQKDGVGKIEGHLVDDPDDLGEDGNVHLRCGTSEYLPVKDNSVDAVITDPPYFDNVMYSETADFYYI